MNEVATTSEGLVSLPAIQEMAEAYRLSARAFAFTFRAVAMPQPHAEAEFVSCCLVAREHGLNPLTKEIYFMRDKNGGIQAIVGIDGWIKKCNEHPQFDGLEFEHTHDDKGVPVSVKARIFRKDRTRAIEVTEYLSECRQVRRSEGPWQSHPNRMLRHRALAQCARLAFGFAGVMDRDEFDQWQAGRTAPTAEARDATPTVARAVDIPDLVEQPAVLDVPDMDAITDEPLADPAGFLEKLAAERDLCSSESDVAELREGNADLIARLSPANKAEAERILEVE